MLTKKEFDSFRKETEQVLQVIAQKYNANITAGKIKYTNDSFNLDLQVTKKEIDGKSFEQAEFEKYCMLYGFKPEDYNKQFESKGHRYTLTGFKVSARTMPILATREDGKRFKFGTEIKRLIA
jgi:16S rRNA U516 pseudouridylate synthase RsuA-like enzyme